jgi:hypothetical protein
VALRAGLIQTLPEMRMRLAGRPPDQQPCYR